MKPLGVVAALVLLALPVFADSVYLVDTGPGYDERGGNSLYNTTPVNGDFQFLAVAFSIQAESTITGIQGWIWHEESQASHINFIIYGNGGGVPDVTKELFNQVVTVPSLIGNPQWSGLTGLSWNLPTAEYWLAFEVRNPELLSNAMPAGAPNAQPKSAYYNGGNQAIGYIASPLGVGVRIEGVVVPEPATLSLIVAGVGLILVNRRSMARRAPPI